MLKKIKSAPIQGPDKRFVALGPHYVKGKKRTPANARYLVYDNTHKSSFPKEYKTFAAANVAAFQANLDHAPRPNPKGPGPKFTASKFEMDLIAKVAKRAIKMAKENNVDYDQMTAVMDLEACHCNGNPLDLNKLLDAPEGDFGHDVFGIRRFIDRETGVLGDCFVPRCSMRNSTPSKVAA